ncbi:MULTISPECIES: hypothetical protein [unclassified Bradyrhizobium]|uniref:hypothetical protein n=1 Tax=unclassified Bradyrhizobium TaxID=2631580 RepID=UPI0033976E26
MLLMSMLVPEKEGLIYSRLAADQGFQGIWQERLTTALLAKAFRRELPAPYIAPMAATTRIREPPAGCADGAHTYR